MKKYITYLIEDILQAKRVERSVAEIFSGNSTREDHFEEVERWLNRDEPEHDFSYYCGLKKEQFPDPELLSIKHVKLVMSAFNELLLNWNLSMDIPRTVPVRKAYSFLISILNRKVMITEIGFTGFDFCTGYPPECEWKEYCPCAKKRTFIESSPL